MNRQTLMELIAADWLSTIDPNYAAECLGVDLTYDDMVKLIEGDGSY